MRDTEWSEDKLGETPYTKRDDTSSSSSDPDNPFMYLAKEAAEEVEELKRMTWK